MGAIQLLKHLLCGRTFNSITVLRYPEHLKTHISITKKMSNGAAGSGGLAWLVSSLVISLINQLLVYYINEAFITHRAVGFRVARCFRWRLNVPARRPLLKDQLRCLNSDLVRNMDL